VAAETYKGIGKYAVYKEFVGRCCIVKL